MPTGVYKHIYSSWNKGLKLSDATRLKMSKAKKGRKPYEMTDEIRRNMSIAFNGRKLSEEHKRKLSMALKGKMPKNINQIKGWNKGKRGIMEGVMAGEKHYNWKGGITPENIKIRTSPEYNEWRLGVFKKDGYRCFDCGEYGIKLEADHIYSFSDYPRLRFELLNGQTLCNPCHKTKTIFERTGICVL